MKDASDTAGITGGEDADRQLLDELRRLGARHDPVPPEALAVARSAIAWRTLDAELAELTGTSSTEMELAGLRGPNSTLLTFESSSLTVEVEVVETPRGRRLLGQLVPPGRGTIDIRHAGGKTRVEADEVGRFRADGLASGPVSLRCAGASGVVETDWFLS